MKSGGFSLTNIVIGLVTLVIFCLGASFLGKKITPTKKKGMNELVMAECERLAKLHAPQSELVDPAMGPTGGGGIYSYSERVVIWKSQTLGVDVKCIGGQDRYTQEAKIRLFTSNGERVNIMSEREER